MRSSLSVNTSLCVGSSLRRRGQCGDGGYGGGGKTHAAESEKIAAGGIEGFHGDAMLAEAMDGWKQSCGKPDGCEDGAAE